MNKWVEPVERNNWEHITTHYGRGGPEIEAGVVDVLWPDGTVHSLTVKMRPRSWSYTEQGRVHPVFVTSMVPYLVVPHHAAQLVVKLVDAGCKVRQL